MKNLCAAIDCPWNDSQRGCQRYHNSMACPLYNVSIGSLPKLTEKNKRCTPSSNQYWLFVSDTVSENDIQRLRQKNDHYVAIDSHYYDMLMLKSEDPKLFDGFPSREVR